MYRNEIKTKIEDLQKKFDVKELKEPTREDFAKRPRLDESVQPRGNILLGLKSK